MFSLEYFDNGCVMKVNVKVVREENIDFNYANYIRSVETCHGWWELWDIDGEVCGFFEADE